MPHPRILIIEDHPLMADAIAVSVQSCLPQADCCFATSLASALAQLASHQPWVLVLVDLNLPDSQGLDTFHAVCQLRSQGAMLVLSALQDNAIKEACVANSVLFVDKALPSHAFKRICLKACNSHPLMLTTSCTACGIWRKTKPSLLNPVNLKACRLGSC